MFVWGQRKEEMLPFITFQFVSQCYPSSLLVSSSQQRIWLPAHLLFFLLQACPHAPQLEIWSSRSVWSPLNLYLSSNLNIFCFCNEIIDASHFLWIDPVVWRAKSRFFLNPRLCSSVTWTLKCHKISFISKYDESNKSINGHDHQGGWANKSAWRGVIYYYDIINHLWQVTHSDAQTSCLIGWHFATVYRRKIKTERPESR